MPDAGGHTLGGARRPPTGKFSMFLCLIPYFRVTRSAFALCLGGNWFKSWLNKQTYTYLLLLCKIIVKVWGMSWSKTGSTHNPARTVKGLVIS